MRHISSLTVGLLLGISGMAYAQSTLSPDVSSSTTTPATSSQTAPAQAATNKSGLVITTPDNIQWKDAPKMLPPGAQYALLDGNPKAKSGSVTIRIKVPANYQMPAIYSQTPTKITIISGSTNIGLGDKLDTNAGTAVPAGSFVMIPANLHHYAWSTEDSVFQITSNGPWNIKYVNASDDPRKNQGANQSSQSGTTTTTTPATQPSSNGSTGTPTTNY